MKVVDDVCWVTAAEIGYRHADVFIVIFQVDTDVLLHLLSPEQRGVHGVLVHHPAVEQTVLWDLERVRGELYMRTLKENGECVWSKR